MKVLNLRCAQGHGFEGWFASEDDFQQQRGRGLVQCPLCSDAQVDKLPSAPRLNLSGAREPQRPAAPADHASRGQASVHADGAAATGMASTPSGASVPATPGHLPHGQQRPEGGPTAAQMAELQLQWMQVVKQVLDNTEDVGERFPEEARRIHYGESEQRGIRGVATPEQRAELAEEGVEVMALPVPAALKGTLQ